MSLTATQQWWVRTDGAETNGGGYDAGVSGAGTNYSDQAAAQLSLTDLACANNTTLTSVTGGFTTLMIGNIIRIASGTHFTPGYYMVTARASTTSVTLDRNPTDGSSASAGVGKLGGAHAMLTNYASGASFTAPAPLIDSPLAPGHQVNVRGAGTNDPSGVDYTPTGGTGYWSFPSGDLTTGIIKFVGYNGRPHFRSDGALIASIFGAATAPYTTFQGFKFSPSGATSIAGNPAAMFQAVAGDASSGDGYTLIDVYFDQNGQDCGLSNFTLHAWRCWCKNTGSQTAGTVPTLRVPDHGGYIIDCVLQDQRGWGIEIYDLSGAVGNVITNCRNTSKGAINNEFTNTSTPLIIWVVNNTLDSNQGPGIRAGTNGAAWSIAAFNNILSNNLVGLDYPTNGDRFTAVRPDFNAFYNNGTARSKISAGPNDVALTADPYTSAGAGDYSLNATAGGGAAARGAAMAVPGGTTTSLLDIGALQHVAATNITIAPSPVTAAWAIPSQTLGGSGIATLAPAVTTAAWAIPTQNLTLAGTLDGLPAIATWTIPSQTIAGSGSGAIAPDSLVVNWAIPRQVITGGDQQRSGLLSRPNLVSRPSIPNRHLFH